MKCNEQGDVHGFEVIRFNSLVLRGESIYSVDPKTQKEEFVCAAVKVEMVFRHIETGKIDLQLLYWCYDKWERLKLNRGKLTKNELPFLLDSGLDVAGYKLKPALSFIDQHEKLHKPQYYHDKLGWAIFEKQLVYKHQNVIGPKKTFSNYKGNFLIEPYGDVQKWRAIIKQWVVGHTPLELMLAAGFSAVLVGLLNVSKKADVDSLIFHLAGNSTTGKTTAVMVAVSAFGSPSMKNGLLQSYNGTKNAMIGMLTGNYGTPIVFDESSMNRMNKQALSGLLYEIAQNMERARMDKDANVKEIDTWATSVFSTGEHTMVGNSNANEGIRARVFEFVNVEWTKDAVASDQLKEMLLNNYGNAAPYFIRYLQKVGLENIYKKWEEYKKQLSKDMPPSKFKDRIGNKFALVLTAAHYVNESLKLNLSVSAISDMLIQQEERSMGERELGPKFYRLLKEKLIQYKRNFKFDRRDNTGDYEIWGFIEEKKGKTYCYILPSIFEKLVGELGFSDSSILMDELKKMDVLDREEDKNKKRKVIFSEGEGEKRKKVLGDKPYSRKGDYTVCIVYQENIFEDLDKLNMNTKARGYQK